MTIHRNISGEHYQKGKNKLYMKKIHRNKSKEKIKNISFELL